MPTINSTDLGDYIQSILKKRGWSMRQAAMKIGVSAAYLSKLINHKADSNPKPETLVKLAKGLNLPADELMNYSGLIPIHVKGQNDKKAPAWNESVTDISSILASHAEIDVYGRIAAGTPTFADEHIIGKTIIPDKFIEEYGRENLFALEINGDSMSRVIAPGFVAIFAKDVSIESGDIAAVLIDGEDATLKRFKETSTAIVLEPESYNPAYHPLIYPKNKNNDFRILGKYIFATSLLE